MKKILCVSLMSFAFLSACGSSGGGGNGSSPLGGSLIGDGKTCSEAFVTDTRAVVNSYNAAQASHSDADVHALKQACDTFRGHHARTVSCQVKNPDTGKTSTVKASDIYDGCKEVDDAVNGNHGDIATMALAGNTCSDQFFADYDALNAAVTARDSNAIANKCETFKAHNSQMDVCDTVVNKSGAKVPDSRRWR